MFKITKHFTFEAAHLLDGHPKCGRLHGHSYQVTVELRAMELEQGPALGTHTGMVRDYAELDTVKRFLDETLDHRLLVGNEILVSAHMQWIRLLPADFLCTCNVYRTTAEELSKWLYNVWKDQYPELTAVTVCETAKTTATYYLDRGLR